MTSQHNGETEDKELLERYRRASADEASAPSDGVRAAILAEGRRVAEGLAKQESPAKPESKAPFDTARPAANDPRWKITAFGTMGAALLAALLIAPRYWDTLPVKKESAAQIAAPAASPPMAPLSAPAPKLESVAPAASSEALQDVVVTGDKRRRADAQAEIAAKSAPAKSASAPPKDVSLSTAPPPEPAAAADAFARAPSVLPGDVLGGVEQKSADSQRVAQALARPEAADRLYKSAQTPATLQTAVKSGDLVLAAKLLDQGTAVNVRDAQGRTPLMLAVSEGRLEVVRLLLQRGADANAADNSGKTSLQRATDQNLQDIAELLRGAGAR